MQSSLYCIHHSFLSISSVASFILRDFFIPRVLTIIYNSSNQRNIARKSRSPDENKNINHAKKNNHQTADNTKQTNTRMDLPQPLRDPLVWRTIWIGGGILLLLIPLSYVFRYRKSIRRRLQNIEDDLSKGFMVRQKGTGGSARAPRREMKCLELNPAFVQCHQDQWNMMSLGQYLTTLRPQLPGNSKKDDDDNTTMLPQFIEQELEVTIGALLLRALGRRLGGAVLPLLGVDNVNSTRGKIATSIASWWASHFLVSERIRHQMEHVVDAGTLPMDLNELVAMANLNQKLASSQMKTKSLELMRRGEVGYKPAFANNKSEEEKENEEVRDDNSDEEKYDLIPNPFVVSKHWEAAITGLESLMRDKETIMEREAPDAETKPSRVAYDSHSRSLPEPTPINQRLLPDLHLGWGDAKCTHTKREVIRNRLLCVLFNKLSYNFYKKEQHQKDLFAIQMNEASKMLYYPQDFLRALIDSGHTVEMCPRSQITTFGMQLCVKEEDGSWTNVPLAFILRSGYERKDSRPAHYTLPHGGMDMRLKGPLLGSDKKCDIQFYMAIEGLCGWHSDHTADVPWVQKSTSTEIYTNEQAILAMKLAAILAVTFNALGTEMDLPFGGYGVLGVCNDTAALIDLAVREETSIHPLISTGRYLMHTGRRLIRLYENTHDLMKLEDANFRKDIRRLINASCKIPSDLLASPSSLIQSSKRFLTSQPKTPAFELEVESKAIMSDLLDLFEQFDDKIEGIFSALNFSNFR